MGKRCSAESLTITPLGIPLISFVGEFDELRWGIERTLLRTVFPLRFAEDNLVRLWWGITSEYGWESYLYSAGASFQHLIGIGIEDLLGVSFQNLLGKLWTVLGKWLHWDVWYSAGEQS